MIGGAKVLRVHELNRKLARLPVVAKGEIRKAIAQSAREMADLAEALVPQDTGRLAGSIGWTWGAAPKGSMVLARVLGQGAASDMIATVYAGDDEAFYARWVEFGARGLPAQPFFYVSYRALRKRIKSRMRAAAGRSAKKVAAT